MKTQDFTVTNELTIGVTTVSFSADKELIEALKVRTRVKVLTNAVGKRFSRDELLDFLRQCDGAIVGLDQIDGEVLDQCPRLKVISKYGVGLDNIDLPACVERGVKVTYPAGVNRRSVAEEALGFMLVLARNLFFTANRLRQGEWCKQGGVQLSGKTVGVIGVGHIGKELIGLLKPFGCRILVNDIVDQSRYYAEHGLVEVSKETIFEEADFISVHTPKTPETTNMIDTSAFGRMKPTAFIINTARGGIVNQADLKMALKEGRIAGAALDAYEVEPLADLELVGMENVVCTPHIGGNAFEAVRAMGAAAIENLAQELGL